ncbi:hypothetical protein UAW_01577 [Enterococcus haemoperoxidus ATCC BAA-382]|uniref:WxL domain-containing protein n=1 Tax=Enterococcus haemoperoxidus ATCC BAA-382 TaxID=1158608 RepID=R2SPG0_9ENTE|nr:hypothetical protein [Enterococcus haemoperoxidus]EOH97095.1 hypothetical protein UAW_01577 [Enterococcus haemoperoxidus ATCC BAA-382]EOT59908.1 hypothetical protein I583_02543 [Enterococcus haemoperoxidus ATCC BAA-382]
MKRRLGIVGCLLSIAIIMSVWQNPNLIKANTIAEKPLSKGDSETKRKLPELRSAEGYVENPELEGWTKIKGKSPTGSLVISNETSLEYKFQQYMAVEPNQIANKYAFFPNVYLLDKGKTVGALHGFQSYPLGTFPVGLVFGHENSLRNDDKINGENILNPKYYAKYSPNQTIEALMFKGESLTDPYNKSANYNKSKFDITIIMTPSNKAIKIDTFVKNNSDPNLVQDSWYDETILYTMMDTSLVNDTVPVRFLGGNRGLYIENPSSTDKSIIYRLNYNFNVSNPVSNWKAGKYKMPWGVDGHPVFNPIHGGFPTYDAPGAELLNGEAGKDAFDAYPNNKPEPIDTAIFMKSARQAFPVGSVMGYSYSVGIDKKDENAPITNDKLFLKVDKNADTYSGEGKGYTLSGTFNDETMFLEDISYSIGSPFNMKPVLSWIHNTNPGTDMPFNFLVNKDELKQGQNAIFLKAKNINGVESELVAMILNVTMPNPPNISANLAIDKAEILEGGKVTFTSTIQNTAVAPSPWDNVMYETTNAFPANIDVDLKTVKLNGVAVPASDVTFGADRKLQVKLGNVEPSIELKLTYDVLSTIAVPILTSSFDVSQAFKVSGTASNGEIVESTSGELKTFTVKPRAAKLTILHLEEGTTPENELYKEEPKEGLIGEKVVITSHPTEDYILSKVLIDGQEKTPLPEVDFEVIYGEVKEVKFYYKGVLRLNSVPEIMDFGQHEATFRKVRVNQPDLAGQKLAITDTRQSKKEWTLKAVLIQEFTNIDDPNSQMTGILRYNTGAQDSETIFELNKVEELMRHTNDSKSEFVVSDTWSEAGFGFKMEVPNGGGKIGKYQARIEYQLGDTP